MASGTAPRSSPSTGRQRQRASLRALLLETPEYAPNGGAAAANAGASVAHPLLSSESKRAPTKRRSPLAREEPEHLLDVNQAAAMLCIKPSTLRNWAYQRRIPRVKLGGPRGPLRFRRSDLERYIRAATQGPLGARVAREVA